MIVGGLNLGGSVEPIYNAVSVVELAADKGAQRILMPISARKQVFDIPGRACNEGDDRLLRRREGRTT